MNTESNIDRTQMELSLNPAMPRPRHGAARRPRRFVAARWWFAQMRDAVREARDWDQATGAWTVGEQASLPLTQPPTRLAPRAPSAAGWQTAL